MEPLSVSSSVTPATGVQTANSFGDLASADFLSLLITQLTNQDPFEPTGNEELLEQISSIRDIELSTALAESLRVLVGQERFGSASALIGQYVTSLPDDNGVIEAGIVAGVRFDGDGRPILQLSSGSEISLERVGSVEPPLRAAEALIGRAIFGVDGRDPTKSMVVEGVVTAVRVDDGEVLLELDTGEDLRFRDVAGVTFPEA